MATARSEELRAVARRFAAALPAEFDEVLLTGSVSRGDAENGTIAWYTALAEGEVLEMAGWTHDRAEARLAGIVSGELLDHRWLRWAEAVVHGVTLRTAGAIGRWQEQLAVYPEQLVEPIVLAASEEWLEHPLGVRAHLRAGGRLSLTHVIVEDIENVLRVVFALNRVWEPSWKRLPQLLAPLAIKPERFAERIDEALAQTSLRAARELVRDTLELAPDLPRVVLARERTERLLADIA